MEDGKQIQYAVGGAAALLLGVAGLYMSNKKADDANTKDEGTERSPANIDTNV